MLATLRQRALGLACLVGLAFLAGCAHWGHEPHATLTATLRQHDFHAVQTQPHLHGWLRTAPTFPHQPLPRLRVYIEGDGAAWWAKTLPPADPTPKTSTARQLAVADPYPWVAYMARPCQYLSDPARSTCPVAWWTEARYGEAVKSQMHSLLDRLLAQTGAQQLELIGHSGGGTLAVLLAAERKDVACLVTLGSPLDLQAWTAHHRVAPLHLSQDPALLPDGLLTAPAAYLFGERDAVVPVSTLGRFASKARPEQVVVMPRFGHTHEWTEPRQWLKKAACLASL